MYCALLLKLYSCHSLKEILFDHEHNRNILEHNGEFEKHINRVTFWKLFKSIIGKKVSIINSDRFLFLDTTCTLSLFTHSWTVSKHAIDFKSLAG